MGIVGSGRIALGPAGGSTACDEASRRQKIAAPSCYNQPFSLQATNTTCYITTQREANPHPYCPFLVGQALTN